MFDIKETTCFIISLDTNTHKIKKKKRNCVIEMSLYYSVIGH